MKVKPEELIEDISDLLVVYLKSGKMGINSFIKKAHLNISQLDQLLKLHFLLKEEVKDFVRELPLLIRRLKTSTTVKNETYHAEVRGLINWSNTIKERLKIYSKDKTIFSVNERSRTYNIKENLVLKEFLETLHNILFQIIDIDQYIKYHWFEEWGTLQETVNQLVRKNIYMSRVNLDRSIVTERMIQETTKHRNPLYRKAAELLLLYRKLFSREIDEELIKALLIETFVYPEQEDVLFELYWVVQLIKHNSENAELQLMDGRNNLVASWHDHKYMYNLYHDSTGSKNIKFNISVDEIKEFSHPYLSRRIESMELAEKLAFENYDHGFDTTTFWSGRPDIVVEIYNKETTELRKIVLGEVKYTNRVEYAITGLRELVDYMKLVKNKNSHFLDESKGIEISGMLFSDCKLKIEKDISKVLVFDSFDETGSVRCISR